ATARWAATDRRAGRTASRAAPPPARPAPDRAKTLNPLEVDVALLTFIILAVIAGCLIAAFTRRSGGAPSGGFAPFGAGRQQTQDAEAEARRWVDRLGASITSLSPAGNTAATQAL